MVKYNDKAISKTLLDHKEGLPIWWGWEVRQIFLENMILEPKDGVEFVKYK